MFRLSKTSRQNFVLNLLIFWWIFWLIVSVNQDTPFNKPHDIVIIQFSVMLIFFRFGCFGAKFFRKKNTNGHNLYCVSRSTVKFIKLCTVLSLLILLISLYFSGAFSNNFVTYSYKVRIELGDDSLTGYKYLDLVNKLIIYPLSYSMVILLFTMDFRRLYFVFSLSLLNILLFSYLWQVNYPIIYLFWIFIMYISISYVLEGRLAGNIFFFAIFLFILLVLAAVNRFHGDILGAIEKYFVGYHLIGFSFYDYQYYDNHSILHNHTYGMSSLGFYDQLIGLMSKIVGVDYNVASLQNIDYNNDTVDIGKNSIINTNAFGTILFTFYRDLGVVGIAIGGFFFGLFSNIALMRAGNSRYYKALFLILSTAWVNGLMVSSLEQPYFWFSITFIYFVVRCDRLTKVGTSTLAIRKIA